MNITVCMALTKTEADVSLSVCKNVCACLSVYGAN